MKAQGNTSRVLSAGKSLKRITCCGCSGGNFGVICGGDTGSFLEVAQWSTGFGIIGIAMGSSGGVFGCINGCETESSGGDGIKKRKWLNIYKGQ